MNWEPSVCCVQPTAYTKLLVRSGPELATSVRATRSNASGPMPQTRSTISGVYRAKCRLRICSTQRG